MSGAMQSFPKWQAAPPIVRRLLRSGNLPNICASLLFSVSVASVRAQPSPAPSLPDPLMSLMLSQPPIDVTSPVVPSASFDPPTIRPGEEATYRVTFNALEESISWPDKLPFPAKFQVRAGAHGQILGFGGTSLQPRTAFNYHVRVSEPGQFTVPGFTVSVYGKTVSVPAAQLQVADAPVGSIQAAASLKLELPTTNLFVGQAVRVSIICPSAASLVSQGAIPLQVTGDGFLIDQTAFRQRFDSQPRLTGARTPPTVTYETILTPIASGKLSAFAQGFFVTRFSGQMIVSGGAMMNGNWLPYTLLDSDPVELRVRPLSREGQLPGFTGAVGELEVEPPQLSTNVVHVGDPVRLSVKVRGDGNLARLVAPPAPRSSQWRVFVPRMEMTPSQITRAQGFATLDFVLVPLTSDANGTPPIPFSAFDPERVAYTDLTIPSAPIRVLPGLAPADLGPLAKADEISPPPEAEPVLSGLATAPGLAASSLVPLQRQVWYPLVQLAPGGVLLGLWLWDRRRRFLEQHPEVLRRRRARRALARQRSALQQAARSGDAPAFAAAAVAALRVVSAPHYPAEPRALVGADVLEVLSETERSGDPGKVVRRFFSSSDATRYAVAPAESGELLSWQGELEKVLQKLEERL
jgi:hypothetical protein